MKRLLVLVGVAGVLLSGGAAMAEDRDVPGRVEESALRQLGAALPDSVSLQGQVVYVDFWASWCVPCRKSFPWMKMISQKYSGDGLLFLGVNVDSDMAAAQTFLEEQGIRFPTVFDPKGEFAKMLDLNAMPSALIFARDGTFALRHEGFLNKDTAALEQLLLELLAEGATE
jgi:thiol-disulfide isomerase/thioredoxin